MSIQGKRVLLIDDDREVLTIMSNILTTAGLIVDEATNIHEALLAIKKNVPQLIFLDINLEGESGFDFLHKLNEQPQRKFISVVILSGSRDPYHIQKSLSLGAKDYLVKPIYTYDVLLKVRKNLSGSNLPQLVLGKGETLPVTASVEGNLVKMNENFFFVESDLKLGETCEMRVNSDFFNNLDINDVPVVFSPELEMSKNERYIVRGNFKASNKALLEKINSINKK